VTETVCGLCGEVLTLKRPGPGDLSLFEDHDCPYVRDFQEKQRRFRWMQHINGYVTSH